MSRVNTGFWLYRDYAASYLGGAGNGQPVYKVSGGALLNPPDGPLAANDVPVMPWIGSVTVTNALSAADRSSQLMGYASGARERDYYNYPYYPGSSWRAESVAVDTPTWAGSGPLAMSSSATGAGQNLHYNNHQADGSRLFAVSPAYRNAVQNDFGRTLRHNPCVSLVATSTTEAGKANVDIDRNHLDGGDVGDLTTYYDPTALYIVYPFWGNNAEAAHELSYSRGFGTYWYADGTDIKGMTLDMTRHLRVSDFGFEEGYWYALVAVPRLYGYKPSWSWYYDQNGDWAVIPGTPNIDEGYDALCILKSKRQQHRIRDKVEFEFDHYFDWAPFVDYTPLGSHKTDDLIFAEKYWQGVYEDYARHLKLVLTVDGPPVLGPEMKSTNQARSLELY